MLNVLIVDDEADFRSALVGAVGALGYRVRGASDGVEALAMHEKDRADIVLSDWSMPGLTGLELCSKVKTVPAAPYVILMSALDTTARLVEGMRVCADDFLRKPIDFDELEVRLLAGSRHIHAERDLLDQNDALRRDSERSRHAARTDPLTGMGNRLALNEELERGVSRVDRYGHCCALVMCDVDFFKQYNDRYGHLAGDFALQKIASAIRSSVRACDGVFRYGGEEFVAVLAEQSVAEAAHAAERIRRAIESLAIPHPDVSRTGALTISAGVAELRDGVEGSLILADTALYRAKAAGRNRVECDERQRVCYGACASR